MRAGTAGVCAADAWLWAADCAAARSAPLNSMAMSMVIIAKRKRELRNSKEWSFIARPRSGFEFDSSKTFPA
jgi:hypothetical protein